jgi:hypothetical protein
MVVQPRVVPATVLETGAWVKIYRHSGEEVARLDLLV